MATTYPLNGANATINSLGSSNFYSRYLAAIRGASARFSETNDNPDVTGLGSNCVQSIPGLYSGNLTIGGYAGSTPYIGNVCGLSFGVGTMYAVDIQSFNITLSSVGVSEITKFNSGSPPVVRDFMPGIFACSASWVCMVDANTPLTAPNRYGDTLQTPVFTYGNSATLTFNANGAIVRSLGLTVNRGAQKQIVQYSLQSVSTVQASGGLFSGGENFGSAPNLSFPWSQGGATKLGVGNLYLLGSGTRKIDWVDAFATQVRIAMPGPGAPVTTEMDLQLTGGVTYT